LIFFFYMFSVCLDVYFVKLSSIKRDLDVNWFMFDCISKRLIIIFFIKFHVWIVWMKIDFECVNVSITFKIFKNWSVAIDDDQIVFVIDIWVAYLGGFL
jgi:hypothetical protein